MSQNRFSRKMNNKPKLKNTMVYDYDAGVVGVAN